MREILFRGKRIYNGEWVYGSDSNSHYRWRDYEVEVISDIFDNLELMGGKTNG